MGIKVNGAIENLNSDERYIGKVNVRVKASFQLSESKANSDNGEFIKEVKLTIPMDDVIAGKAYEALKAKYPDAEIEDVLED